MKRATLVLSVLSVLSLLALPAVPAAAQQKDDPACKDHPLFTRMPDSWIHGCTQKQFDAFVFQVGKEKEKTERVEGRKWTITYYPQATAKEKPSELQILRNFENAAVKAGGKVLFTDKSRETFRIAKLLKGDAGLKLSQGRADSVVRELVQSHGIASARLRTFGAGPFAPVASNDSEEGRAKNRRVELVKQ